MGEEVIQEAVRRRRLRRALDEAIKAYEDDIDVVLISDRELEELRAFLRAVGLMRLGGQR